MAYTVTITGQGETDYIYAEINGTQHVAPTTLTVQSGTMIKLVTEYLPSINLNGYILVDGVSVGTVSSFSKSYRMTVSSNVTIALDPNGDAGIIVTTESEPEDPMAPKDGHNTNIGSVAFEIEGGTVNIGGVAYELDSGLILAGGTSREIAFAPSEFHITISGTGNTWYCYVTVGGTKYYAATEMTVAPNTNIVCFADSNRTTNKIILNGTTVKTGDQATYTHTVTSDLTIKLNYTGTSTASTVTITTS